ncbi:MAG: extracellular solute-binding protein family 1 [Gemmatimonadetes bacterium]|nr:extracellular solute-binding protein family 1 [Gemmatimonadota bacterium]
MNPRCLITGFALASVAACGPGKDARPDTPAGAHPATSASRAAVPGVKKETVTVAVAASLFPPIHEVAESLFSQQKLITQIEAGPSMEMAQRATLPERTPDVVILADDEVFERVLVPRYAQWHARFARNRLVVAFTPKSRFASEIKVGNWYEVLRRPGVRVGRADPKVAPAGYNAILMLQLAERFYHQKGLANDIIRNAGASGVTQNAASLAALLVAGEVDYIIEYESVARSNNLGWVALPPQVNLGNPDMRREYGQVSMKLVRAPGDTAVIRGAPITYGLTIPAHVAHNANAEAFLAYLLSDKGKFIMRRYNVDVMDSPLFIGNRR